MEEINDHELETIISIFKHINPGLNTSVQDYLDNNKRPNYIVRLLNKRKVIAYWIDIDKINEAKLKILFKRHKEVDKQFFIQYLDDFYRIGFKIKK
ncbi:hypothetical protein [Flavobacterium sp. GCM10023249]|uniref:hypothetical protein n=1 Tax=unclassified Flavobacterium TaxID=196869 RepID=UPI0036078F08